MCCNVSFSYKHLDLDKYLGGKDIPLLTTLGELKGKIPHTFFYLGYCSKLLLEFFSILFLYIVVGLWYLENRQFLCALASVGLLNDPYWRVGSSTLN